MCLSACAKRIRVPGRVWKRLCDEAISELAKSPEEAVPRLRDQYHSTLAWLDQELLGHLRWLLQKDAMGQDVFLVGPPGPARRCCCC